MRTNTDSTTATTSTTATSSAVLVGLGAKLDTLELTTVERAVLDAIIHTAADTPDGDEVSGFGFKPASYRDRMSSLQFTCQDDLARFTCQDDLALHRPSTATDRNIAAGAGGTGI